MALQITRSGGDFQKVVFESVTETLPGGLVLDLTGYTAAVDGMVPAGTLLGRNTATGMGRVVPDVEIPEANVQILGLSISNVEATDNVLVGVVMGGIARLKALPANEVAEVAGIRIALPKISII